MNRSLIRSIAPAAVLLVSMAPLAASALDGAKLYKEKTCLTCHGKDGKTTIMPNYPKIAGQNRDYLLQQMRDIKSGARNNGQTAAMKGIMHLVNDAEMEALADYIATMTP